jgi:hypothetical protein
MGEIRVNWVRLLGVDGVLQVLLESIYDPGSCAQCEIQKKRNRKILRKKSIPLQHEIHTKKERKNVLERFAKFE